MASKVKQPAAVPKVPLRDTGFARYSSLGDVALTNPVLDGLWAAFPRARIFFATKKAYVPAIQNHPALDRILTLEGSGLNDLWGHLREIRDLNPDMVLDLHDSLRTQIISYFTRKAKFLVYDKEALRRRMLVKKLNRQSSPHTIQKYLRILEPLGIKPHLKIHFKVFESKKDMSFLREFLERKEFPLPNWLLAWGRAPAGRQNSGCPKDMPNWHRVWWKTTVAPSFGLEAGGNTSHSIHPVQGMRGTPLRGGSARSTNIPWSNSIALMGRCDLFIGNDSGLTHLASGRGCRVVVIYGSTTTSLGFEPWGPHSVVEVSNLTCRPCDVHGKNACPLGHFKCMGDLTVDLVEGAVKRSVRRSR